jgi:hypothetical protein
MQGHARITTLILVLALGAGCSATLTEEKANTVTADGGGGSPVTADGGGGSPVTADGGAVGPVTADGGGVASELLFAAVGDTRPPLPDDDGAYPTAVITKIFADIEALTPHPPIVIGTGDYQFTISGLGKGSQKSQLGHYNTARSQFTGVFWPAMGNHECDSITADNCGPGTLPGDPDNYTVYRDVFLTPLGEANPYYSRVVSATDGSWTAKFIVVAPNYWSQTQQTWFQQQLDSPTTYTFVIHHENAGATGAPASLATIEKMEAGHETLSIVGHNHIWHHDAGSVEVIIGNGGAPLDASGQHYGYTLFARQPDGSILVSDYDYMSNQLMNQFSVP